MQYNANHRAVKRIMREIKEFADEPSPDYSATPIENDIFEWHFTIRGPPDSEYEGGIYHGRIVLPIDYPLKPPDIIMLTPSGRFKTDEKICLSISGFHPEHWHPAWSIRTALIAIRSFMPTPAKGAVGSLEASPEKRKTYAKSSVDWKCSVCKKANKDLLLPEEPTVTDMESPSPPDLDLPSSIEPSQNHIDTPQVPFNEDQRNPPDLPRTIEEPPVNQNEQIHKHEPIIAPAQPVLVQRVVQRQQPPVQAQENNHLPHRIHIQQAQPIRIPKLDLIMCLFLFLLVVLLVRKFVL